MRKISTAVLILTASLFLNSSKAQAYAAADYYNAGLQLYNAQNYAQAAQYFSAAVQMDPTNMAALQGRANCYYTLGRYSEALADYQKVDSVMPSPALDQMIQSLQAKVAAAPGATTGGGETPTTFKVSNTGASHGVVRPRSYRISPYISLFNLSDFNGNAQYMANSAASIYAQGDTSVVESGTVPTGAPGVNLEVENPILPDFNVSVEVGLTAAGTAQDNIQDDNGLTWTDSFNMLLGHFGVLGRLYLGDGDLQPWVAAGPIIDFGSVNSAYNVDIPATSYSANFSGPSSGVGFGGQAQLGIDYKISDNISISAFAGYQVASISNFSNTVNTSSIPNVASGSTATLSVVPTSTGNAIIPVDNGILCFPTYDQGAGSQAPAGTRPATIDDSGVFGGLSVAFHL